MSASEPAAAPAPTGPFALVVEDSMPLRRMLVKILSTLGLEAHEAGDGQAALTALEEKGPGRYSIILCDLMMPIMDGASFVQNAKTKYSSALPPILICSSRSDREAVQVVMKLQVAGYILKPFKTDTVVNKIRELLPDLGGKRG